LEDLLDDEDLIDVVDDEDEDLVELENFKEIVT